MGDIERKNESEGIVPIAAQKEIRKSIQDNLDPPDGGRQAWLVMFASFLCNGVIFGTINSYGTIHVVMKDKYEKAGFSTSDTMSSLLGSLLIGTTFLLSPISGVLVDRLGIRKTAFLGGLIATLGAFLSSFTIDSFPGLCFTFSIMVGSGSSLVYTPSVVILGHYFKRYHGVVNGFVTIGSALFGVILPHVFKLLFQEVGISNTFRVVACLKALLMVCSLSFKPVLETSIRNEITKIKPVINMDNWRNPRYILWLIAAPIAMFGYFVPYVHLVAYVKDILPESNGEGLLTCIGITAGIGKILLGIIADRPNVNPLFLQQFSFVSIGVVTMMLTTAPFFNDHAYISMVIFSLILGAFDGCYSALLGPIAVHICGPLGASQAIGFILGLTSFPFMLGPLIAGILYDHLKSYTVVFLCSGAPPIIGAMLMCGIYYIKQKKEDYEVERDVDSKDDVGEVGLGQDNIAYSEDIPSSPPSYTETQ